MKTKRRDNMLQRIITGAGIAVVVLVILFSNIYVTGAFVALLALFAQYEFLKVAGINDKPVLLATNQVFSLVFSIMVLLSLTNVVPAIATIYIVLMFSVMLFRHEKVEFTHVATCVFSLVYITASMLHIVTTRQLEAGNLYIFLIFIGAFATDTCAYFVGVLFGKHKLCPKISPKKTIEGAIGGEIGTVILMLAFGYVAGNVANVNVNYLSLGILGVLSGLFSQLGDLTASIIKRQYGVKDYGNLLPGHGGIMDRIDSIVLMAPLVYYFVTNFCVFY